MIATSAMCMALAIYFEARGEDERTQKAVYSVVKNRAKHGDYCSVVTAKGQFSWASRCLGKNKGKVLVTCRPSEPAKLREIRAAVSKWKRPSILATHFHSQVVRPGWAKRMKLVFMSGGLKFYKEV